MISFISLRFIGDTPVSIIEGIVAKIACLKITYGIACVFDRSNDLILRFKLKESVMEGDIWTVYDILENYAHWIVNTEES